MIYVDVYIVIQPNQMYIINLIFKDLIKEECNSKHY